MKINIERVQPGNQVLAIVQHEGNTVTFNISEYGASRSTMVDVDNAFNEFNRYLATLPNEVQNQLWTKYVEIRHALDDLQSGRSTDSLLKRLIGDLFQLLELEQVFHWVQYHSRIRIPSDLKDRYEPNTPEGRTYLRKDYQGLVTLAIVLRAVVPVWGEYLSSFKRDAGDTFKEYIAFGLLYETNLLKDPIVQKLDTYVRLTLDSLMNRQDGKDHTLTAVIGGLSTDDIPNWVLANIIVRRLAAGRVDTEDDTTTVIKNVYTSVGAIWNSVNRRLGKGFGSELKAKRPIEDKDDEDVSYVETYKIKQEVSDGTLEIMNVYTENYHRMIGHLDPEIPMGIAEDCLLHVKALESMQIAFELVPLVQWVMHRLIPARGIPLLAKQPMLRVMAATQAALWHWGFPDLAALCTATKLELPADMYIAVSEPRSRIEKDQQERLDTSYPYTRKLNSKQESPRRQNVAHNAIDVFCDQTRPYDWYLNCSDRLISQCKGDVSRRRMSMPMDIRSQLVELFTTRL